MSKHRFYGSLAYFLINTLNKTLRTKTYFAENYKKDEQYIYAFWHGKIFIPTTGLRFVEKRTTLASASKDGDVLEEVLKGFGYEVIRGSSSRQNVSSLKLMLKKLKAGFSLGFAMDGPKGPAFKIKPGTLYMSQKTAVKVAPIGGYFPRKWIFEKAWDKFELPKPFSKAIYYIGNPIEIPKDEDMEDYREIIENAITNASLEAEKIYNERKM